MKLFSGKWNSSKKKNKQTKYRENAPLHIKSKFIRAHLSKELKEKYGKRNIGLKKGDKVKISRGQYKGKEGVVEKVLLKKSRVHISGIENMKRDGSKSFYPMSPSNLIIISLELNDKKREIALKRKGNNSKIKEKKKNIEVKK